MKNIKKWILSALCATCAFAGVATLQDSQDMTTASAAVATVYETVDTTVLATIKNEYIPNGNFSLYFVLPELDTGNKTGSVSFGVDIAEEFNKLGLFDKVKIGNKTLKEYGCTGFWTNAIGINEVEIGAVPHNHLRLYCHADPELWQAAHNSGEISFSSPVTVAEGALIPGYAYLNGDDNAKLYRTGCDYVTTASNANYGITSYGETEIESFEYVQGHDGSSGYLGVSLKGDDYVGDGVQVELNQNYKHHYANFTSTIMLNGRTDATNYYGLYNLGEKGKGYYSFATPIPETELETITVPAGTLFPSKGLDRLNAINNTYPLIVFRTQTTQTFYKNAEGKYVSFESYLESAKTELTETYNAKLADCFAEDAAALNTAYTTAQTALESATAIEDIDAAYMAAKATFEGIMTKTETISAAKADLDAYKAEEGYFRTAEKEQRDGFVATAKAALDSVNSKAEVNEAVATAKAGIDALKTAAQYADEELAGEKTAAKAEIEGYLADTVYLEEQATVRTEAVTAGLAAVVAAKNSEEIALAVTTFKSAVDALETKASIVDAAKADLNAYKAEEGLYREAQATERAGYIATAETAMDNAATQAAVNEAVATAKAAIDTLKTDAELTAEEQDAANKVLAQEKEVALDKINEIKAGVNYTKYSTENQAKINDLYKTAKDLIADALTSEEISAAVSAFETEISKVPQVEEKEEDNNDVTPDDDATSDSSNAGFMAQLGCTSVVGVSGVMALTITLGAVVCAKKRKEN